MIVFNGRRTRIARNDFTEKFMLITKGIKDVITIIKSSRFHVSFRYAFGGRMKPNAIILINIYIVYNTVKVFYIVGSAAVFYNGSSMAILKEFNTIVSKMKP